MIKRFYYIALLLTGCLFLHPFETIAQKTETPASNYVCKTTDVKDTTILVHGIFVTMRMYLPAGYTENKRRCPVIYVINTDSANIVSKELSSSLADVVKGEMPAAIIIELKSFQKGFQDAEVNEFAPYIINFKKYVDKNYLTLKDPESAIIVGFRQSAPVAIQMALNNPEVFGRSGIFLADFSLFTEFKTWLNEHADKMNGMMFLHSFDKDISENGKIMNDLMDQIGSHSKGLLYNFLDPNKNRQINLVPSFIEFYKWILSNGHNYIIHANEKIKA